MRKLTDLYPVGTPVRVTYEWEGDFYFFDGEVTEEKAPYPPMHVVIGYATDYDNGLPQNVYAIDKVESLESLHTPKES